MAQVATQARMDERGNVMFDAGTRTARWTGEIKAPGIEAPAAPKSLEDRVKDIDLSKFKLTKSYHSRSPCSAPARPACWTEEHDALNGREISLSKLADEVWGGLWEVVSIRQEGRQSVATFCAVSQEMRKKIRERRAEAQMGGEVYIEYMHSFSKHIDGPVEVHGYCAEMRRHDDMPSPTEPQPWMAQGARFQSKSYGDGPPFQYEVLESNPVMARIALLNGGRPYFVEAKLLAQWSGVTLLEG